MVTESNSVFLTFAKKPDLLKALDERIEKFNTENNVELNRQAYILKLIKDDGDQG